MTSRLLVADDSITIQKIVSMAFEIEDVEVEGIGNGQEAFDRISQFNPDIVLADVDMPGLDGFELSAKIKESPETSSIKVLLLASDFEEFDEQRYQNCGADNHISKPFKSDDIVAMVKSLLQTSSGDEGAVMLSGADLVEEEPQEEEPSLEELLESVEKLSTEGGEFSSSDDEVSAEALEQPLSVEDETTELTDEELIEPMELSQSPDSPEPVELSAENEVVDLSPEDLMEPMEFPEPLEDLVGLEAEKELAFTDDDIMDQMIRGVEELRESVQSPDSPEEEAFPFEGEELGSERPPELGEVLAFTEGPEIFAEIRPRKLDNLDELDSTFKEIVMGGGGSPAHHEEQAHPTELSSLGGIVPEPEDLLERIAPGAFSEVGRRSATPENIKENLDAISGFSDQSQDREVSSLHYNMRSENWGYEAGDNPFTQAIADEVKQLLQRSLGSSLEKEVSGLSEAILKTVREVVREITPEIARRVIREEIEKIKKQDMY
jgi:CheY-like chemotaxis protein